MLLVHFRQCRQLLQGVLLADVRWVRNLERGLAHLVDAGQLGRGQHLVASLYSFRTIVEAPLRVDVHHVVSRQERTGPSVLLLLFSQVNRELLPPLCTILPNTLVAFLALLKDFVVVLARWVTIRLVLGGLVRRRNTKRVIDGLLKLRIVIYQFECFVVQLAVLSEQTYPVEILKLVKLMEVLLVAHELRQVRHVQCLEVANVLVKLLLSLHRVEFLSLSGQFLKRLSAGDDVDPGLLVEVLGQPAVEAVELADTGLRDGPVVGVVEGGAQDVGLGDGELPLAGALVLGEDVRRLAHDDLPSVVP